MEYFINVVETYSKEYKINADSEEEAIELADALASKDDTLVLPHNMSDRRLEVIERTVKNVVGRINLTTRNHLV
jgi:hypothetical protein